MHSLNAHAEAGEPSVADIPKGLLFFFCFFQFVFFQFVIFTVCIFYYDSNLTIDLTFGLRFQVAQFLSKGHETMVVRISKSQET